MADADRKRKLRRRILILFAVLFVVLWVNRSRLFGPGLEEGSWVQIDLEGAYPEQPPAEFIGRFFGERRLSLLDLLLVLRDAREDERVAGVVLRIRPLEIGWAKAQDIRDALVAFRDADKPVIAYMEQEFGSSTLEYYIASAARTVYLPPGGTAPVNGLQAEYVFLGGVWEKLDIRMNVEKIREYKTFGDMLAYKEMSPYHREMANSLLDSIFGQFTGGIADGRGLDEVEVRAAIDASPSTATELEKSSFADGARFLDELREELLGEDGEFTTLEEFRKARRPPETTPSGKVAVVFGVGPIVTGESPGGGLDGRVGMGSDTLADAFREAADDDDVKAIVFRIDSPGGSALASDLIWRATQQARREKPVIVSMSDVAGSGGYYVAAGANRIFSQPGTFTGSIGVVLFRPNVSGFLERLGVHTETLSRGRLAELTSVTTRMTEAERDRIVASMNQVYDLFVRRVGEGRDLDAKQVDEIGRGRVWTGEQAVARGLVDELGGFFKAIDAAKSAAGVPPEEKVELLFLPRPKSLAERLSSWLGVRLLGPLPEWWKTIEASLAAYRFQSGSILTLMPEEIDIR